MISRFLSASPRYAEDDGLNVGGASETAVAEPQGQGSSEAPVIDDGGRIEEFDVSDVGQAATEDVTATEETPASFYQYDYGDDDGVREWKTKEEFDEFFREGVLRHSDYTNKTKELGFEREKVKAAEERAKLLETSYLQGSETQRELKGLLDTLSEAEFKDLIGQVKQKYSYATNPAMKRLDELEQKDKEREEQLVAEKEQAELETKRGELYDSLAKEIPDFNKDTVYSAVKKLQEIPPGEEMRSLALLLHYAEVGKTRAAEYARKIAKNRQTPSSQPVVPNTVGVGDQSGDYSDMDWNELSDLARKETGLK